MWQFAHVLPHSEIDAANPEDTIGLFGYSSALAENPNKRDSEISAIELKNPITNNLNFSSPETELGYWQLSSACDGISKACIALETPVTGGNVSLYNESKNQNNPD